MPGLLLGGSVTHERGPDPVDAHVLGTAGLVVGPHLLAQHGLLPYRPSAAAMFFRPGQRQQTVGCKQFAERLGGGEVSRVVGEGAQETFLDVRGYQLAQALSKLHGIGAEFVVHSSSFRQSEQSLADDVALDFRCAAVDGRRQCIVTFEDQVGVVDRTADRRPRAASSQARCRVCEPRSLRMSPSGLGRPASSLFSAR